MATYKGIRSDLDITKSLIVTDEELVWNDLWALFNTVPGERVKMLDFGSYMRYYLYEPNDSILQVQMENEVTRVIGLDPRLTIKSVNVTISETSAVVNLDVYLNAIGLSKILNFDFIRKA